MLIVFILTRLACRRIEISMSGIQFIPSPTLLAPIMDRIYLFDQIAL